MLSAAWAQEESGDGSGDEAEAEPEAEAETEGEAGEEGGEEGDGEADEGGDEGEGEEECEEVESGDGGDDVMSILAEDGGKKCKPKSGDEESSGDGPTGSEALAAEVNTSLLVDFT